MTVPQMPNMFQSSFNLHNIVIFLLYVGVIIIGLIGIWFILSCTVVTPSKKSKKIVKAYLAKSKAETVKISSIDIFLDTFSKKFVKYIHLDSIKRSEMVKALYISKNPKTPEEYMAYIYTVSGMVALFGLVLFLFQKVIGGIVIAMAVGVYIIQNRRLTAQKKEAIENFEMELPRYTAYLKQAFKTNKNVISVMEGYLSDNDLFVTEMNQAIADAKTSNFNGAMARLDQRVNSDRMKMVIHGLLSAFNGEEVEMYFAMLEKDFSSFEVNVLKKAIKTIPQKMQLPKILLFSSIFLTMFLPLAMQIVDSFRTIFNSN